MRATQVIATLAVVAAGLTFVSCSQEKPEPEEVLRPVRVQQVFARGGVRTRTFSGVAQAGVESKLSFKVGGTIERLVVDVGNKVTAGQLIAELDADDYRIQVQDAKASLSQAEAQERRASADYDRARNLYENRNASKQELDNARATHESTQAGVESARQRLELARNQLKYTRLTAPVAGDVASVDVEVNENVRSGQKIVLLTSRGNMQVQVAIPEILISHIREGDPVTATFDALHGREFPGTVIEVGVAATGVATTFPVTVGLEDAGQAVRSGMAAEVAFRFESETRTERYSVRPVAVGEDRDGRFVFVVEPSDEEGVGVVKRRNVTVAGFFEYDIDILDGLSDGDFVVTAGVSRLVDGQRVRFSVPEE